MATSVAVHKFKLTNWKNSFVRLCNDVKLNELSFDRVYEIFLIISFATDKDTIFVSNGKCH
jgi:hypothetical protein